MQSCARQTLMAIEFYTYKYHTYRDQYVCSNINACNIICSNLHPKRDFRIVNRNFQVFLYGEKLSRLGAKALVCGFDCSLLYRSSLISSWALKFPIYTYVVACKNLIKTMMVLLSCILDGYLLRLMRWRMNISTTM